MIKWKFGDSVRSKGDVAMINEVLCKILAHNLCCLIQEQCELGIETEFWGEQMDKKPDPVAVRSPLVIDVLPAPADGEYDFAELAFI
jgi:hypothetical protein